MIRKTDPALFMRLLRKMLHQLNWKGIEEAEVLLKEMSIDLKGDEERETQDENRPLQKRIIHDYDNYISAILKLTSENFTEEEILWRIQKCIQNDNTSALNQGIGVTGFIPCTYFLMQSEDFITWL